jgi:hypothetical protein
MSVTQEQLDALARYIPPAPLTAEQVEELCTFLAVHHPPLAMELSHPLILPQRLPILYRTLYEDMQRFKNNEPTRYIGFASTHRA